jgi:arginyl-tRNA synthetase
LRYFLLKFTRNAIIAFDFKEALSFDGETGPYLQYATVRGNNILGKLREVEPHFDFAAIRDFSRNGQLDVLLSGSDDIWEVVYTASRLDEIVSQVMVTMEPATLAKYAFTLAQKFSLFYHRYRIIQEDDEQKRLFYLAVVELVRQSLMKALDLMGIDVPKRM